MSLKDYLAYLCTIRTYFLISAALFLLASYMGYAAAELDPETAARWMEELERLRWITEQPPLIMMMIIFLNNLLSCGIAMLLGIGFGLVPLLVLTTNGFLLGVVSHETVQRAGTLSLVAGILPHGIVELPTVLICISMGFRLGHLLVLALLREEVDLAGETAIALSFLLRWLTPLFFVAAAIETFITPIAISVVA